MNNLVEIKNLNCIINKNHILKDVSFSVKRGEFIGLIGPNGSGKSSLLKCICRINIFQGTIIFNGIESDKYTFKQQAEFLAYMEQSPDYEIDFTVYEVISMGRYPYISGFKTFSDKDLKIIEYAINIAKLKKIKNKLLSKLSIGEKQRVFFARTIAQQTPFFLLDEPTAALDVTHKEELFKLINNQVTERKAIITVLHDLKDAAKYCTRLILLNKGSIVSDGTPKIVLSAENLKNVYNFKSILYLDKMSGNIDFCKYHQETNPNAKKIHIIGGNGSSIKITNFLLNKGHKISIGVLMYNDSDVEFAKLNNIPHICEIPFHEIQLENHRKNIDFIKNADITILPDIIFGKQNIKNLEACYWARKLIILVNMPINKKDFTNGKATNIYNQLTKQAVLCETTNFNEINFDCF